MPSDRARIRPGVIYGAPEGMILSPPVYNGETISVDVAPLTLSSIEGMLGMSSTIDLVSNIKSYIMDNLAYPDEDTKSKLEAKVDRIIETLGRNNYMPTRRVYRNPPTHVVFLDDESVERFINKISRCTYIKWRLASPIYCGVNNIGLEGTFKR